MGAAEQLIAAVTCWAQERDDIVAAALVGSHARGEASKSSDIDLVLLSTQPGELSRDADWTGAFGTPNRIAHEDWGLIQSVRVFYEDGPEVEFGIGGVEWAADPPPPGTLDVLRDGAVVLHDPRGLLGALLERAD